MQAVSQAFRCFDAVARRGSVRKAAETLHLTAAAVHQQIVNFEQQVGTPLFDRLPKGMQLTAAGEIVLGAVRRMQRDFEQALAQVEGLGTLERGHVSLGVPHASAETLLPPVLREVLARHPGIRFDVRTGNGEALLRWLAGGEVDLAFCLRRVPPPGVVQVRGWPQRLGAVVAPRHPLAARAGSLPQQRLRLRDCLAYPLVLTAPDMELRLVADRVALRERRALEPAVQTSSVALARSLAAAGPFVALLVQENVLPDLAAGTLVWLPLADADARSEVGLYQREGHNPSVAAGLLVQALDAAFQAFAGPPAP
ncbi:MAG: LysR family transcriptional regulator [Rubrivivax sp.]|nr:LysR family transcriptional regulator [Rubrivivax sp.]